MAAELEKILYEDLGGFRAVYVKEADCFWHFHPEYEIFLNKSGCGTRIIGDNVELFEKFNLVLIAGNIPHCWNYNKNEGNLTEKQAIMLHFRLESFGDTFLNQHEMKGIRKLLSDAERGLSFSPEVAVKADDLMTKTIFDTGISKIIDFFNLLRILITSEAKSFICSENYKLSYDQRGNKRMAKVYTYINENYYKHITLQEISSIAKMSPVSFSRYFKENCGIGFVEYLNSIRTNKACYLLRETDYQVLEISRECGFGSISSFNKQFRKTEGVSPRHYRAQFKE